MTNAKLYQDLMLRKDGLAPSHDEEDIFATPAPLIEADAPAYVPHALDVESLIPELSQAQSISPDSSCTWPNELDYMGIQTPVIDVPLLPMSPPFSTPLPLPSEPSPSTKRKTMDSVSPLLSRNAFFPNKKSDSNMRNACPPLFDTVMQKVASVIKGGTSANPFFNEVEQKWLNGDSVKFSGQRYWITKDEIKPIFAAMAKKTRVTYLNDLWDHNKLLLQDVLNATDHAALYDIFVDLSKIAALLTLKKFIWEKCEKFADYVFKKDVIELKKLFINCLINGPIVQSILQDLWKNTQVSNELLAINDIQTTNLLWRYLMKLSDEIIAAFLEPGRPLSRIMANMNDESAVNILLDCAICTGATEHKMELLLSFIGRIPVLEKAIEKIKVSNTAYKSYLCPLLEERIYAIKKPSIALT